MNLLALANHLWQSTILATIAWLLIKVLQNNSARVRYSIWMLASLKFLLPLSLLITLGSHLSWPARGYGATMNASVIEFIGVPFGPSPFQQEPLPAWARSAPTPSQYQHAAGVVLAIWLMGIAWVVISRLIRVRRVWEILRTARRLDDGREIESLERARSLRGFARRIECVTTESVIEPGIHGILRPILVLPSGVAERLQARQLDAIVDHELCHIRSYDNLWALIHMGVEAIFWFHPLVWWLGTRLVDERERACDEQVLENGGDPKVYASAILKVCEFYVTSPLQCVAGVSGGNLKKRIEDIMNHCIARKLSAAKKLMLAAIGVATLMGPIVLGIINAPSIQAQTPQTKSAATKFEVASIRACEFAPPVPGNAPPAPTPGRLTVCLPVMNLILQAYGRFATGHLNTSLAALPIEGGPAWIRSTSYQINAKAEGDATDEMMRGPMMQALLEDRFKLKMHRETREVPMYALTASKGAAKLKQFKGGCTPPDLTKVPPPPPAPGQQFCDYRVGRGKGPGLTVDAQGRSLDEFSRLLGVALDRPVVNRTGVTGVFDIHVEFATDSTTPNFLPGGPLDSPGGPPTVPADPSGGPSIFTAIQEQLGLKLEPIKEPGQFLVIDSVERPSEN